MVIKVVSDDFFEIDVFNVSGLVFVDFWVEWCGFCKQIFLVLEEIVLEMVGEIIIVKVNIDDYLMMLGKYGVCGILMLMIFKDGQVVLIKIGVMVKGKIIEWVKEMFV